MLSKLRFDIRWPHLSPYPPFSMGWMYPDLFHLYPWEDEEEPSANTVSSLSSIPQPATSDLRINIRARNAFD
ncbi:hypothetical protein SAMN05444487_1243 [Marininema mesophilum]|uniref:Uncharacterized protein n=1 Tax=Marininema mesophilum TaxID=1048340 RepID=A0A1H3CLR5_9BACL|nr:hypothetical protein [Marininema mesophilum]SDX55077.1 hypothetical protein SAMN05444487_1243 [Marininema mesophilum]